MEFLPLSHPPGCSITSSLSANLYLWLGTTPLTYISHRVEVYLGGSADVVERCKDLCEITLYLLIHDVVKPTDDPTNVDTRMKLGLETDLGGYTMMVGRTSRPYLDSFSQVDVLTQGRPVR